jgi:HD superfamily phosphohydrolase
VLSEIISGEAFGVDRMDYLLRDSLHLGVAYGRFDHYRLIDSLRILPSPSDGVNEEEREPQLGVTEGGLHSAEALLLARYFMFTQVYFHPVRRIYDLHLGEFLKEWLPGGEFSSDPSQHLEMTDAEVLVGLRKSAQDPDAPGHDPARRLIHREHFKVLWERNQPDLEKNSDAGRVIFEAAAEEFGQDKVRRPSPINPGAATIDFPVLLRGNRVSSAQAESDVLQKLPPIASDAVYVEPALRDRAGKWLRDNIAEILERVPRED